MKTVPFENCIFHSWYCPALGAYRKPREELPAHYESVTRNLPWVALFAFPEAANQPPEWVLRSYFSELDGAYYASHRTVPEKTAATGKLVELYAAPGSYGNGTAGHVPPKEK
jgi:hypothetical protein